MRILSSEEIGTLLPAVSDAYRAAITTLVFTGMRIGEAEALEWSDVDFDAGLIRVRDGKTENAARSIVMMPSLARVLRAHQMASGRREGLVFATATDQPLCRRNALRALNAGSKRAGQEKVTLHELRHTFASIMIGQGMDVTFVADQLGHADPAITLKVYAKLFDPASRRDEARERLEQSFGVMVG
jgi:integrase